MEDPLESSGMATAQHDDLFPAARNPPELRVINHRCLLRRQEGHCVVQVAGIVLASTRRRIAWPRRTPW